MNEKATFLNDESRHGFMNFLVKSKLIIDKKLACILIVYENHLSVDSPVSQTGAGNGHIW